MHHAVTTSTVDLRLSSEETNNTNTSHNNNIPSLDNSHIQVKKEIGVGHAETKFSKMDDPMQIDGETNDHVNKTHHSGHNNGDSEEEKLKQEKLKRDEEAQNYYKNLKLLRQSVVIQK